jgi:hypothetical protein
MFGCGEGGCQGNNEPCLAATVVACHQHDVRMRAPVQHFVELTRRVLLRANAAGEIAAGPSITFKLRERLTFISICTRWARVRTGGDGVADLMV